MSSLPFSWLAHINENRFMCCDVFFNGRKRIVAQLGSVNLAVHECDQTAYDEEFYRLDSHDMSCTGSMMSPDDSSIRLRIRAHQFKSLATLFFHVQQRSRKSTGTQIFGSGG